MRFDRASRALLVLAACLLPGQAARAVVVSSPSGAVSATIETDGAGQLAWSLAMNGRPVIETSPLGVTVDGVDLCQGVALGAPVRSIFSETYPRLGPHSTVINHYNQTALPVTHSASGRTYTIEARAFDDGFAYRTVVPAIATTATVSGEASAWRLPAGSLVWYHSNTRAYEGVFEKAAIESIAPKTILAPPVTIELPGGGYAVITEAALRAYSGMSLRAAGNRTLAAVFEDDKAPWPIAGAVVTPWRVTIVAPDLDTLVNTALVQNLNAPPSPELAGADWIRPGRAVWSWWSEGNAKESARQFWYVDRAAELGFEYCLVDAGWEPGWKTGDKTHWDVMQELVEHGRARGVGIWVWRASSWLDTPQKREWFFGMAQKTGLAGVKIDFVRVESKAQVDWYIATLEAAARHKLMLNFHGCNKPTGLERTFPNELTREAVWGMEHTKQKYGGRVPPSHNAALPFTRCVVGPGDYTPCVFDPQNLLGSSFAHQLAMPIVVWSPVMNYADNPEHYLKSAAADVIESIPTVWDETRVLPGSKIGELAAIARRKGEQWFVGVVNGGARERNYEFALAFLKPGVAYRAIVFEDERDKPDQLRRSEKVVKAGETMRTWLRAGGGFVARLTP